MGECRRSSALDTGVKAYSGLMGVGRFGAEFGRVVSAWAQGGFE